ncbi:hypothetical protein KY284_001435 [Solanum tuberosum]|nr:hypothetical protein KY284_001435 [Solanum tuberosum]
MKEGEPIHEMSTKFSSITDELTFVEELFHVCNQVSKTLEILPRPWTNNFVTGNETRESEVVTLCPLFEHL